VQQSYSLPTISVFAAQLSKMFHRIGNGVAVFAQAFRFHPVVENIQRARRERFIHRSNLMNGDVVARFYFCGKPHHIPIGETNATVARSVANRTRIVRAVNADSFFIERNLHVTYRIPRTWWEQIKIPATLPVLEHLPIVTKSRELRNPTHLPLTDG
jgi:hypothetical protein